MFDTIMKLFRKHRVKPNGIEYITKTDHEDIVRKLEDEVKKSKQFKPPKGKVMICDLGRSADMRLIPDCTWEGGVECSGLELHYYNEFDGCCSKGRWFCVRAGVHRRCRQIGE